MPMLFKHQMDAINKLKNGSILVGGVGSGKSRTSLGYFYKQNGGGFTPCTGNVENGYDLKYNMHKRPKDLIIVTTAKKRDSMEWEQELALYMMTTDASNSAFNHSIKVDSWNNIEKYSKTIGAFFIFDEQRVGGTGKWAKTFIRIARNNEWILLSATPGDTWSDYAPVFIANGFYRNFSDFRRRHCVYSRFTKYPKIDHYIECGILESHRSNILVYMEFKRPTVQHHEYIKVSFDSESYDKVLKKRWNIYEDRPCQEIAELCAVLRKIVNTDRSRLIEFQNIYEKHTKLIVFYNYDYELEALRRHCSDNHITYSEWNGHHHDEIPETDSWVYLVQYRAGAEGWNCIKTDCILFYSQTYSYKDSIQAAGRIDRMNTPFSDLYYYHMVSSSKMDVAIYKCLKLKKSFNEKAFCEQGGITI